MSGTGDNGRMRWTVLDSPIGEFSVATDGTDVCRAHFGRVDAAAEEPGDEAARQAVAELRAYFAGELTGFAVPLAVPGGSDFERGVWREMTRIPYGETLTYGEVARRSATRVRPARSGWPATATRSRCSCRATGSSARAASWSASAAAWTAR